MKSCKQCDEYDVCSRQNDLRRKKPRCPKAKTDKPVTNYDCLISKTPEELAAWIADQPIVSDFDPNNSWHMAWFNWLKSPAAVEVDDG